MGEEKLEQLAVGCLKYDGDLSVLCLLRIYHLKPANEAVLSKASQMFLIFGECLSGFGCVLWLLPISKMWTKQHIYIFYRTELKKSYMLLHVLPQKAP